MNLFKFADEQNIIIKMLKLPGKDWYIHLHGERAFNVEDLYEKVDESLWIIFGRGPTPTQALVDLCHRLHGKTLLDSTGEVYCNAPMILTL